MTIAEIIAELKKENVSTALGDNLAKIVQALNTNKTDFDVKAEEAAAAVKESMKRKEKIRELEAEKAKFSESQSTLETTISQLTSDKEAQQKSLEDYQAKFNSYNEKNKKEWESVITDFKIKDNEKVSRYYDFENDTPEAVENNLAEFKKQQELGVFETATPPSTPPSKPQATGDKSMSMEDLMKKQFDEKNK